MSGRGLNQRDNEAGAAASHSPRALTSAETTETPTSPTARVSQGEDTTTIPAEGEHPRLTAIHSAFPDDAQTPESALSAAPVPPSASPLLSAPADLAHLTDTKRAEARPTDASPSPSSVVAHPAATLAPSKSTSLSASPPVAEANVVGVDTVKMNDATPMVAAAAATTVASPRKPQRPSQRARHSTKQAGRPPSHATSRHSAKSADVSCANFFFHREEDMTFGVGTVGLYAAKPAPAAVTTLLTGAGAAAATHETYSGTRTSGGDGTRRSVRGTAASARRPPHPQQTPLQVNSPLLAHLGGSSAWEQREEDYRAWKERRLATSSYARLSHTVAKKGKGTAFNSDALAMTDPGPQSFDGLPQLWDRDAQLLLERRRLRALEVERVASAAAQAQSRKDYDTRVLCHRARKLKGEPVDLPDSYFRFTYPDPSAPRGYTAPAARGSGDGGVNSVLDDLDPQRLAKDHLRACQLHRVAVQQRQINEEARRQEAAEKHRQSIARQLEERRVEGEDFNSAWMSGRPRISRSREKQQHDDDDAEKCAIALWNRSRRAQERELYAQYATEEAAETTARQQVLRKRVLTRPRSRRGRASPSQTTRSGSSRVSSAGGRSGRLGKKAPSTAASPPASDRVAKTTPTAAAAAPTPPPHAALAATTRVERDAIDLRPVTPSQLVGPTSTNFFNELKLWTQEFPSPNTAPINAAEATHRRAWKAELDEAQRRFNRESTQRQREEYPRRILEAREKTQETNWEHAQHERQERKTFAVRRADQAQADLLAATAMRVEVQEEERRAQLHRQMQAAERHDEVQFQRFQSQQREMVLHSLEAEELQQLRMTVSANSTRG